MFWFGPFRPFHFLFLTCTSLLVGCCNVTVRLDFYFQIGWFCFFGLWLFWLWNQPIQGKFDYIRNITWFVFMVTRSTSRRLSFSFLSIVFINKMLLTHNNVSQLRLVNIQRGIFGWTKIVTLIYTFRNSLFVDIFFRQTVILRGWWTFFLSLFSKLASHLRHWSQPYFVWHLL